MTNNASIGPQDLSLTDEWLRGWRPAAVVIMEAHREAEIAAAEARGREAERARVVAWIDGEIAKWEAVEKTPLVSINDTMSAISRQIAYQKMKSAIERDEHRGDQ